jgi:hypothetical protein
LPRQPTTKGADRKTMKEFGNNYSNLNFGTK